MKTITVQVQNDHLENLSKTKPMTAMAELIWNALDAESTEVRVEFVENELGGVEEIRIFDNGHGLHYEDAQVVFQNLGGSWKREGMRTRQKQRILHGKYGKGRFRAFAMGNRVIWNTVYAESDWNFTYSIQGNAAELGQFSLTDSRSVENAERGMIVCIADLAGNVGVLRGVKAQQEVTDIFALYLRQYPDVKLSYDNVPIDPANAEEHFCSYGLPELVMENGERVAGAALDIVEWNLPGKRGVYLCDENGFMLQVGLPRLYFRGFNYTAYLKSAHLSLLDREGLLDAGELSSDVRTMLNEARRILREHFTLREAEKAQDLLAAWKETGLYPYEGEPRTEAEANERRIFEIYATHLNQIFPDFATSSMRNRRLTLRLFQELVKTEPTRIARVLDELVDFPEEKEEEILELVQA